MKKVAFLVTTMIASVNALTFSLEGHVRLSGNGVSNFTVYVNPVPDPYNFGYGGKTNSSGYYNFVYPEYLYPNRSSSYVWVRQYPNDEKIYHFHITRNGVYDLVTYRSVSYSGGVDSVEFNAIDGHIYQIDFDIDTVPATGVKIKGLKYTKDAVINGEMFDIKGRKIKSAVNSVVIVKSKDIVRKQVIMGGRKW